MLCICVLKVADGCKRCCRMCLCRRNANCACCGRAAFVFVTVLGNVAVAVTVSAVAAQIVPQKLSIATVQVARAAGRLCFVRRRSYFFTQPRELQQSAWRTAVCAGTRSAGVCGPVGVAGGGAPHSRLRRSQRHSGHPERERSFAGQATVHACTRTNERTKVVRDTDVRIRKGR